MKTRFATLQSIDASAVPSQSEPEINALWDSYFKADLGEFDYDPNNGLQNGFLVSLALSTLFKLVDSKKLAKLVYDELPQSVKDLIKPLAQTGGSVESKKRIGELIKDTLRTVCLRYIPEGAVQLVLSYLIPVIVDLVILIVY